MRIEERVESYRERRTALPWLDAHAWIGVGAEGCLRQVASVEQTIEALVRYGIRRAIVAHALARDYDPSSGNRLLLESIAGHDMLWGAAVLAPDDRSAAVFRARLRSLVAAGVRMVRVFPRSHNWALAEWCVGPWLSVLEELRVPFSVWHTEAGWAEIAALCEAHPKLPVIVEGPNQKLLYHNRVYCRLLERFPNFHLEIHNLVGFLGLDDVVHRFGSRQLVFGTYLPHQDPNVPMALVTDGEISPDDRENIAHGNMERLIAEMENAV